MTKIQQKTQVIDHKEEFQRLSSWYQEHIPQLSDRDLEPAVTARWQSVQTEIRREFKLLSTDMLFLASARQNSTKEKRVKNITAHLTNLISYCQIILSKDNN